MKCEEMEKVQFKGLRAAMGYRESTPKNVILEETKIASLRERAIMLAKENLAKIMIWGREELKDKIIKLEKYEMVERMRKPRGRGLVQNEAWRRVRKDRGLIRRQQGFGLYKEEYWGMTERMNVEYKIEEDRKKGKINDEEMLEENMIKYKLDKGKTTIVYTDGSKIKKGKSSRSNGM